MVSAATVFDIAEMNNYGAAKDVRFLDVNAAFEKLTGFDRDRVAGNTIRGLWPDTEQIWFDQFDLALRQGRSEAEGFHRPLNRHLQFSVFRLNDPRFGATFSDISTRSP